MLYKRARSRLSPDLPEQIGERFLALALTNSSMSQVITGSQFERPVRDKELDLACAGSVRREIV
ncbi:hypothetical protein MCERH10_01439 [Caulobacteraceae bacterium]